MKLLGIIDEDFINYKKISMVLEFPYCTFKCNKDCGFEVCQNYRLKQSEILSFSIDSIISAYIDNPITESIVFQGLEPLDSFKDVIHFIKTFRKICDDDIVIFTGYKESEIQNELKLLENYQNIIIKFGRFIPNSNPRFDKTLGITLNSDNQYAKKIS